MPDLQTFESYRPLLFSIAYRMLGSAMEAEDMVQEAYLRYEKAEKSSRIENQDIQSPKAYLTTIVTRLCLDQLKSAKTQRENYFGIWLPEPLLTSESPSAAFGDRETISTAFLVLLENLSPIERAIFILRDVFEYSYAEIAPIVGKSEANCRRYERRAKQYLAERQPRFDPSSAEQAELVEHFMQAIQVGEVENLTHMLAADVTLYGDGGGKMPSIRQPLIGPEAVTRLIFGSRRLMPADTRIEIAEVNGTPALLFRVDGKLALVMNLVITDGRITSIYNMLNPDKLAFIEKQG